MKLAWQDVIPFLKEHNLKIKEIVHVRGSVRFNVISGHGSKARVRTIKTDPSRAHSHEYPLRQ